MQTKTGEDLALTELTKSNYVVPAGEEGHYHARVEVKKFDQNTGERQSIPRIQKFGAKTFKTVLSSLKKQGFAVDILHDPSEYLKTKKADDQASKQKAAQEAAKKAEERKQAERDALKDELRKELLAELKAESKEAAKTTTTKAAEPVTTKATTTNPNK